MPRFRLGQRSRGAQTRLVVEALERTGWRATRGPDWDLYWSNELPPSRVARYARAGRWLNHVPGIAALVRKDALAWTLALAELESAPRARHLAYPETFRLPAERASLRAAAGGEPDALWICKPPTGSCGRGIALVADVAAIPPRRALVVQRYLDDPHLIDGCKYTLRCYVALVAGERPRAFLFDDGFAKLCTKPFTTDRARLRDRVIHLTNPEVQRRNRAVPTSGRNLTHRRYRARLRREGIDDAALWTRIRRLVSATVSAGAGFFREEAARLLPEPAGVCFDLLGFDLLVDAKLAPWVIECNLSPSLAVEASPRTPHAREELHVKRAVVRGLLALVGAVPANAEARRFQRLF